MTEPTPDPGHTPSLVGRSSSHFTRVTRIFASELGVTYTFEVVPDLRSVNAADYAGNPALRMPILRTGATTWFGALNICRELARRAPAKPHVVWPEHLTDARAANAQELATQAMATEVTLIMSQLAGTPKDDAQLTKLQTSLLNMLTWLDDNIEAARAALPQDRALSYMEVCTFCLVTHLEFRKMLDTRGYRALTAFCDEFGQRASARATAYRFDAP
ncbi:glutathione S-transferase N-terminal domain-containing protein [Sorangium sp. So ce1389]|uniref:glutathione S-transferase N-terminal domain-containing protein n=1 Tax=Sorangium sp. So ce1389 TaxID=3133336 RepID=UPI003F608E2D